MAFNSFTFLIFFTITYLIYSRLKSVTFQNSFLLVSSYIFYGAWDWRFLFLIIGSTLVDFYSAQKIHTSDRSRTKKKWLIFSLGFNLGMLSFFKYCNFGIESFIELLAYFGIDAQLSTLNIILPIGISFYTFQTISYTVDVYRNKRGPTRNFLNFSLYVAFFPQLIAGPIEKSTSLLPQLEKTRRINSNDIHIGLFWILLGYFKKIVIADTMAPMVEKAFDYPDEVTGAISLITLFSFALQIYGDFSGYTLIARGTARLMGIKLIKNFNAPYLATSPRNFWKRWHISLSTWLQEYLYFGLGGSRNSKYSKFRTCLNIMITMILGGLWHGAQWNFVFWGLYHGILLIICNLMSVPSVEKFNNWPLQRIYKIIFTFLLTTFGWLIFRVDNMNQFMEITTNIITNFSWNSEAIYYLKPTVICFSLIMIYHVWLENKKEDELAILKINLYLRFGIYSFMLITLLATGFKPTEFIYFQF